MLMVVEFHPNGAGVTAVDYSIAGYPVPDVQAGATTQKAGISERNLHMYACVYHKATTSWNPDRNR
jgi:hypothetical protein